MSANKALRRLDARIKELKITINDLQSQIENQDEDYQNEIRHAENRAYQIQESSRREKHRLQEEARRTREEAVSRDYERQRIARDLERAVDWKRITGADHFGDIERLTRKLSRGY